MSLRGLFFLLSVKTADVLHIKFIKVIVAPVNEAGPGNRVFAVRLRQLYLSLPQFVEIKP